MYAQVPATKYIKGRNSAGSKLLAPSRARIPPTPGVGASILLVQTVWSASQLQQVQTTPCWRNATTSGGHSSEVLGMVVGVVTVMCFRLGTTALLGEGGSMGRSSNTTCSSLYASLQN